MIIGLINCIKKSKNLKLSNKKIVEDAYKIERKICGLHGGWQDQIVSQYGNFLEIKISKKGKINVRKIKLQEKIENIINKNFLLVYTHTKRISSDIILSQKKRKNDISRYYDELKLLNEPLLKFVKNRDIIKIGEMFNYHWKLKKSLSNKITDKKINKFYNRLINECKIIGGKLIGAGGGGFFLICTKNKKNLCKILDKKKISYINFKFEKEGSRILRS